MSGFSSSSDAFEKTAANQFSLPVWAGLLVYVLVTPITEEIVHRGVIYNRLRRYFNLPIAVVVSSLLFGISHGNLVQLIYGAVMGVLICLVYERYGAFIYPLVYHCVANAVIYVFMSSPVLRAAVFSVPGIALEALMTVAGVYMIFAPKNY